MHRLLDVSLREHERRCGRAEKEARDSYDMLADRSMTMGIRKNLHSVGVFRALVLYREAWDRAHGEQKRAS